MMTIQPTLKQRLQALVDHPSTPPPERENAQRRLAEIAAREAIPPPPPPRPTPSPRERLGNLRGRPARRSLPTRWPFGWEGPRGPIDREVDGDGQGGIAVGWQCPSCGSQVERRLTRADVARLSPPGRPSQVPAHIERMIDGTWSQLCMACWDRWESA